LAISATSCLGREHGHDGKRVPLFIFGDSLFDAGNNNYINTVARANFWPYGETFFKYPTGRFCDGRLIPDFIAEYAELPLIPPYLQPGNYQFGYGANFASAGAGALDETHPGRVCDVLVINLNTQLTYFKDVEKQLMQKLGDEEATKLLSEAVYLFSIGSNDYGSLVNYSGSQDEYVEMVIGNMTVVIKEVYRQGGRNFGILGVAAVGCVPAIRNASGYCMEELATLVKLHNEALHKILHKLERQLEGFTYSYFDFYTVSLDIIDNPFKYEKQLMQKLGDEEATKLLSEVVYLFSIGSNDYGSLVNYSGSQDEYVEMVIGNMTVVIKEIYRQGGRNFRILGVAAVGCVPAIRNASGYCMEELATLVKLHNEALHKILHKLERQLEGFTYSYFDFYTVSLDIIDNPFKYVAEEREELQSTSCVLMQVINLNTQLTYFKDVEKQLMQKLGDEEATKLLSEAVYLFSIGSNDYGSLVNYSGSQDEYVEMVIGNMTVVIKEGKNACCGSGPYRGIDSCGGKRGITEYKLCTNAIVLALSATGCLGLEHQHGGKHVPRFVFGNSLFDAGNNNYINSSAVARANFWPYGETLFKYPTGRFSDGRLIPDFIAEYAKLPLIPPYLQPGNHQFGYGLNFPAGGAGALNETYPGVLVHKLGDEEATQLLFKAVFLVNIGTNDYGSLVNYSGSHDEYVEMVIRNLTAVI
ncbi:hypothetical protein RJ640_023665, partial [Escallonia rubra]